MAKEDKKITSVQVNKSLFARLNEKPAAAAPITQAPIQKVVEVKGGKRDGHKWGGFWINEKVYKKLQAICIDEDIHLVDLVNEALLDEVKKRYPDWREV